VPRSHCMPCIGDGAVLWEWEDFRYGLTAQYKPGKCWGVRAGGGALICSSDAAGPLAAPIASYASPSPNKCNASSNRSYASARRMYSSCQPLASAIS